MSPVIFTAMDGRVFTRGLFGRLRPLNPREAAWLDHCRAQDRARRIEAMKIAARFGFDSPEMAAHRQRAADQRALLGAGAPKGGVGDVLMHGLDVLGLGQVVGHAAQGRGVEAAEQIDDGALQGQGDGGVHVPDVGQFEHKLFSLGLTPGEEAGSRAGANPLPATEPRAEGDPS